MTQLLHHPEALECMYFDANLWPHNNYI